MATYRRSTVVEAPLADVWDFHARSDGLTALTPDWMGLSVETIRYPADTTGGELAVGTEIDLETRPFGVVPGGTWTVRITARERAADEAMFRDETLQGPFEHWVHTHRFVDVGFGTLVTDEVSYSFPIPGLDRLAMPCLAVFFGYRHWRTRQLLE